MSILSSSASADSLINKIEYDKVCLRLIHSWIRRTSAKPNLHFPLFCWVLFGYILGMVCWRTTFRFCGGSARREEAEAWEVPAASACEVGHRTGSHHAGARRVAYVAPVRFVRCSTLGRQKIKILVAACCLLRQFFGVAPIRLFSDTLPRPTSYSPHAATFPAFRGTLVFPSKCCRPFFFRGAMVSHGPQSLCGALGRPPRC